MGAAYVYALLREDGSPFYVGKGHGDRWLAHEANCKPGRSHKDNIVAGFKARGLTVPKVKVAVSLSNEHANRLERRLIAGLGRTCHGGPLTNLTGGGDGCPDLSPEAKERHRRNTGAAQLGKKHSPGRRAILAAALKGKRCSPPPTPETTAKRKESLRRAWALQSPEQRAARGMAGRKHSDETKAKMRAAALGRVISAGQRAATSAAHLGRKHTAETRANMAAAQLARWAIRKAASRG